MDPGYASTRSCPAPRGDAEDPLRLAVLGDSTVAGVGSPTAAESLAVLIAAARGRRHGRARCGSSASACPARGPRPCRRPARPDRGERRRDRPRGRRERRDARDAMAPVPRASRADAAAAAARAPVVVLAGTPRFHANPIIPEPLRTFVDRYAACCAASSGRPSAPSAACGSWTSRPRRARGSWGSRRRRASTASTPRPSATASGPTRSRRRSSRGSRGGLNRGQPALRLDRRAEPDPAQVAARAHGGPE